MKNPLTSGRPLRSEVARAVATFRTDPALLRQKLRQRWAARREVVAPPGQAPARPRIASVSQDIEAVASELRRLSVGDAVAYGEVDFLSALSGAVPGVRWTWMSHRDDDVLAGATPPSTAALGAPDAIVVGGGDVKTAYINALRLLDSAGVVKPVLWVGENFEFCGSTLPVPEQAEGADVYLFHHFADFFPIKDPLLVRVTATDARRSAERLLLMRPQQTIHLTLDELLPDRTGTAVVEVRTTHPALTGNRHPRWRVWADVHWGPSFTSLHGAHDYGPDRVCEGRMPLSECTSGSLVLTLPNYGRALGAEKNVVRWAEGDQRRSVTRDRSLAVEQLDVSRGGTADETAPFLGYHYQGYGTSYWYAFQEGADGGRSIRGNHEVTVAQVEHRPPLSGERRRHLESLEAHNLLLWPHGLPILAADDDLEFGFSFEWANPQVFDFRCVAFDEQGRLLGRTTVAMHRRGYHWADEMVDALGAVASSRPALVLVSPDWSGMDVDPQQINAFGNLAVRSRSSGDGDLTEFQSCWRNLGLTVDGFPHWLHPSKGVVGRTNVIGHVRTAHGRRTALVLVHGSGNLNHATPATVRVRLHAPSGAAASRDVALPPFTRRLVWMDELFDDAGDLLADGFGTCVVTSPDADINCQMLTTSASGGVSLQHLWGY